MDDRVKQIVADCQAMKLKALEMALGTGSNGAHIGGAFSAMEILAALYAVAHVSNMKDEARDRVIVSKGHCVLALYTALWCHGFITDAELATFDKNGTSFFGHPHRDLAHGIEFSGGSLGLGLSYAVGVALACRRKGLANTVYVLLGDGECDEGIVWEALMSAASFKLENLVLIVDRNKFQVDGTTIEVMNQYSLEEKFRAFGYDVTTVDGHSIPALLVAYGQPKIAGRSRVIIADTVKAHGISFLENNKASHHCMLSKKKYEQAVAEITAGGMSHE